MLIQRLVLRLLLATVFFHTVLGVPLHEAGHMREALAQVEQVQAGEFETEDEHTSGALCAWCLVHADLTGPVGSAAAAPAPCADATQLQAQRCIGGPAGEGRWPFAARDPPRVFSA